VEHLTHRLHVRVVAPQDLVPAGEHRVGHVLQAVHREGAVVQELELGPGAAQRGWNSKRDKNPKRIRERSAICAVREDAAFRLRNVLVKYPLEQFRRDEIEDFDKGENLLIN
jgi:hypothetical protein